ncbi:MAG: magnesium chelatase subunit I, partial [Chitinophagaceae bacterium]
PYKAITKWFDAGNHLDLLLDIKDEAKISALYQVDGLFGLVKKYYPHANEKENALLMEFVLHGLSAFSLISKKTVDGQVVFKDLMGSMMNLGSLGSMDDEEFNEEDYR